MRMKRPSRARSVAMLNMAVQVLTGSAMAKVQRSGPVDQFRWKGMHQTNLRMMLAM